MMPEMYGGETEGGMSASAGRLLTSIEKAQGCLGGFPYLVGKYLTDMGVVAEACFPMQPGSNSAMTGENTRVEVQLFHHFGLGFQPMAPASGFAVFSASRGTRGIRGINKVSGQSEKSPVMTHF